MDYSAVMAEGVANFFGTHEYQVVINNSIIEALTASLDRESLLLRYAANATQQPRDQTFGIDPPRLHDPMHQTLVLLLTVLPVLPTFGP